MARLPMEIREAVASDAPGLIALWRTCVDVARSAPSDSALVEAGWPQPSLEEATEALAALAESPTRRLWVALAGTEVVGAIQIELAPFSPLHLQSTVVVSELHVLPRLRRKGVAWSLMGVATDWAAQVDSELVFAWAPSASRDAHRFLTRIGFGQYATVRAARVRVLRARAAGRVSNRRQTGRLIAVRRSLRRTHDALSRSGRD